MADEENPHLPPAKPPSRWGPDLGQLYGKDAPWWARLLTTIVVASIMGGGAASYRMDDLEDDLDELTEAVILMRIEVAANHGKRP